MASAQSSPDIWRGRGRQPQTLGNAQPRHRSESRRLSDRRRPVKTAARHRDHCSGELREGDPVQVFSRSADQWVEGEIVKFSKGNFVRVEYEVGEYWCGKSVHIHSDHLIISLITSSGEDDHSGAFQPKEVVASKPTSNARWLLSCKFDEHRGVGHVAKVIVKLLGEDVVSNPNRWSKSCCTIGEKWDDNYNKGDNEAKYLHCWEPDAMPHLQCSKAVLDDQEPTEGTCWKSSYFWRLKKCRKMLRLVEDNDLGEGQNIEKAMAEFLGAEVRVINVSGLDAVFDQFGSFCLNVPVTIGCRGLHVHSVPQVDMFQNSRVVPVNWMIADKVAPALSLAGFVVKGDELEAMKETSLLWQEHCSGNFHPSFLTEMADRIVATLEQQ